MSHLVFWESSSNWREAITSKKSLFGALFGAKVWLDLVSMKTTKGQLSPLIRSVMVIREPTFFACYWRIRLGEYAVSTRRCQMPQNSSKETWRWQLPSIIMRFNTIRLFCGALRKTVFMQINLQFWALKNQHSKIMVEIPPNMCQKVIENNIKWINACNTSSGDNLNDVVF